MCDVCEACDTFESWELAYSIGIKFSIGSIFDTTTFDVEDVEMKVVVDSRVVGWSCDVPVIRRF